MLINEAINIICKKKGVFLIKSFVKNHIKLNKENNTQKSKYYCENHKKHHKYTFHSHVEFVPGTGVFLGFDTAKEVIVYAKSLIK